MDIINLDISMLQKAIKSLMRCFEEYKINKDEKMQEYIEDALIKRFEFTVETSWKMMKKYLKLAYGKEDKELTMNNIFRFMQGNGIITSWENWKTYYEKRNDTSHDYNEEKSREIINLVEPLLNDVAYLYNKLEESIFKANN